MNTAQRLKQKREAIGLDRKAVAYRAGISYQYVRQLEEGVNEPPTWELLRKLAIIYGTTIDALLGFNEENMTEDSLSQTIGELLRIARGLPEHRQRDLLALAELFSSRRVEDDTQAMNIIIQRAIEMKGAEAEEELRELLRRFGL